MGSDVGAGGMRGAAGRRGVSVPGGLWVGGCDGSRVGQWLGARLTTLGQRCTALALAAMDAIERSMAGTPPAVPPARTVLPLHLVVRGSVARPADG